MKVDYKVLHGHSGPNGTRWGDLRNMAEVPLFVDSRASRIVQLADLVAWAVWRRYEHQDTRYFDRVIPKFDSEANVTHGLVHYRPGNMDCSCPACLSRKVITEWADFWGCVMQGLVEIGRLRASQKAVSGSRAAYTAISSIFRSSPCCIMLWHRTCKKPLS